MRTKKILLALIALVVAACFLGACGAKDAKEPVPDGSDIQTEDEKPPKPEEDHSKDEVYCNHSLVIEQAVDATCTAAGRTEGIRCTKCGEVRKESQTIPALAHTWLGAECATVRTCFWCGTTSQGVAEHTYENDSCRECGAFRASEGLVIMYNRKTETCLVTGIGSCTDTNVFIPEAVNGYPVTAIDKGVFANATFSSIYIPASVTEIGEQAFKNCANLTKITVAKDNPVYYSQDNCMMKKDGKILVFGCKTSVIPDDTQAIGDYAFCGSAYLEEIVIPDSVKTIGAYAFAHCTSLKSAVISQNVTVIESNLFAYCKALERVVLPDNLKKIGYESFQVCAALTEIVIPETVESIANSAFNGAKMLKRIIIPDSVKSMGTRAFYNCDELKEVKLGSSLTYIGSENFYECDQLRTIKIPKSVETIGYDTFYGCTSLKNIYCEAQTQPIGWNINWINSYATMHWGVSVSKS